MSADQNAPPTHNEDTLLLQVVLEHADSVEELLAEEIERRKALELELVAAKEAAEEANRAKGLLLAKVNHDLRSPVGALIGFTAMLAKLEELPPQAAGWLGIMGRAGRYLEQLTDDLLDMTRIEAGKMELAIASIDLHALVKEVAEINRSEAELRELELRLFEASEPLPARIRADGHRLRRILNNLLGNAIKFTGSGWVSLAVTPISSSNSEGDGQIRIRFEVRDSGRGFDAKQVEQFFRHFGQGDHDSRHRGLGLGLAISRDLVELMGGEIMVESKVGEGSRFWFDLQFPVDEAREPKP
jgi:signal transduction histidine kinase